MGKDSLSSFLAVAHENTELIIGQLHLATKMTFRLIHSLVERCRGWEEGYFFYSMIFPSRISMHTAMFLPSFPVRTV